MATFFTASPAHSFKAMLGLSAAFLAVCAFAPSFAQSQADVTFEDIYAAPDDETLNLRYAREQADRGDLMSSAAALERMLFAQPNWDSVRLFYALVLYRLDDRQAAMRELGLLEGRPLTPKQRATLESYKSDFRREGSGGNANGVNLRGRISLAGRYDDNAGNALGDVVFGGGNNGDESLLGLGVVQLTAPFSDNSPTSFVFKVDAQLRRHEDATDADYDVYGAQAGIRTQIGEVTTSVMADFLDVNVSGESYLRQTGGELAFGGPLFGATDWTLMGGVYDQDYENLSFTTNEENRSGTKLIVDAGLSQEIGENFVAGVNLAYEDKSAKDDGLAYDGYRARANFRWSLGEYAYLRGNGEYRKLKYKADSFFLFPAAEREDENLNGRVALGSKANGILQSFGAQNDGADPFSVEVAVNYTDRSTNIPNSGYENLGGELRLIYDF